MDVFHQGMLIAGCPAVVTHLEDGATSEDGEDGAGAEGFYLAAGEAVAAVDMYVEGGCPSALHAAKATCDAMVDCMGFRRDAAGCVTWIMKDSTLSEYTAGRSQSCSPRQLTTLHTLVVLVN